MNLPLLPGKTIRMEPVTLDHLPALEQVALDDSHWRWSPVTIKTPADLRAWVETSIASPNRGTWLTVLNTTGEIIGSSSFLDFDPLHRTVEIGSTWLTEPYRGTGHNAEAKLLQLTHAFEDLHLRRVAFKIHHGNLRSQAAVRKLGATEEGTFRNHYLMPDGSARHSVWFSIIDAEWPAVKARLEERLALKTN